MLRLFNRNQKNRDMGPYRTPGKQPQVDRPDRDITPADIARALIGGSRRWKRHVNSINESLVTYTTGKFEVRDFPSSPALIHDGVELAAPSSQLRDLVEFLRGRFSAIDLKAAAKELGLG